MDIITPQETQTSELLALLNQATAAKPAPDTVQTPSYQNHERHNPDDFEPETSQEPETPEEVSETPGRVTIDDTPFTPDEMAETIVDLVEMGMDMVLVPMYRKSTFTNAEFADAKDLLKRFRYSQKTKTVFDYDSATDFDLLERIEAFDEYRESIPFEAAEKKRLIKHLKPLLVSKGIQLSPEAAMLGVAGLVMAPRIMPLVAAYMTKQDVKPE